MTTKKRIVIAAGAGVAVLVTGGTAFAFYTSGGSGTGTATVGTTGATDWSVSDGSSTDPALLPGGTQNISYTVTNNDSEALQLTNLQASVATGTDAKSDTVVVDATTKSPVPGCLASWFTIDPSKVLINSAAIPTTGISVPGKGSNTNTATVTVPVVFNNLTDTNQDACQAATNGIEVDLTINK